jgi:hypothetical protein
LSIVRQVLPAEAIADAPEIVESEMDRIGFNSDLTGKKVGITVGSRGIDRIDEVVRTVVERIKTAGGQPFILPSMGSHGGATPQGRLEVLEGVGVAEDSVGAPILPDPAATLIAESATGMPVYCLSAALQMDHIVLVNRIKQHTDFSGAIESGLHKILAIGLGSLKGADTVHRYAMFNGYEKTILDAARTMLAKLPVLFGLGIVENWQGRLAKIEALKPDQFYERETALLILARQNTTRLPFDRLHVLIIGEIGKNISGACLDPKAVGRIRLIGQKDPETPCIDRILVLSLTPESHGNAAGIGLVDLITRRVFDAVDIPKTVINCVTSMAPEHAALPCTMDTDREAIEAAIRTVGLIDERQVRLVYIQNTNRMQYLAVSDALLPKVHSQAHLAVVSGPHPMAFDTDGRLTNFRYDINVPE